MTKLITSNKSFRNNENWNQPRSKWTWTKKHPCFWLFLLLIFLMNLPLSITEDSFDDPTGSQCKKCDPSRRPEPSLWPATARPTTWHTMDTPWGKPQRGVTFPRPFPTVSKFGEEFKVRMIIKLQKNHAKFSRYFPMILWCWPKKCKLHTSIEI